MSIAAIASWFDKHWASDNQAAHFAIGCGIALTPVAWHWRLWLCLAVSLGVGFLKEIVFEQLLGKHFNYSETWDHTWKEDFIPWALGVTLAFVVLI